MAARMVAILALAVVLSGCSPAAQASPSVMGSEPATTATLGQSSPAIVGWSELAVAGAVPAAREDHTWTISPDGATAYLFGGRDGGTVYGDLWSYSLGSNTWSAVAVSGKEPPARFGHNAAWADGIGLVIFAGQAGGDFFNDLWAYDPATNAWRSLPASGSLPVARYGSCAAVGPDGRLWMSHGFTSEGQRFADTRAYDFVAGNWTDETPAGDAPIQRCLHACWWTDDGALRLYGGQTTRTIALGDLWQLTRGERPGTNAWTQTDVVQGMPPARNLYAASHWGDGALVIGGQGADGDYLADTWWLADSTTAWEQVDATGPSARSGAELIADADGGRLLLFGGRDSTVVFGDLWQLAVPDQP